MKVDMNGLVMGPWPAPKDIEIRARVEDLRRDAESLIEDLVSKGQTVESVDIIEHPFNPEDHISFGERSTYGFKLSTFSGEQYGAYVEIWKNEAPRGRRPDARPEVSFGTVPAGVSAPEAIELLCSPRAK